MTGLAVGRYASPLRYPGGKGKVANYLKLLFLKNGLLGAGLRRAICRRRKRRSLSTL